MLEKESGDKGLWSRSENGSGRKFSSGFCGEGRPRKQRFATFRQICFDFHIFIFFDKHGQPQTWQK